MSTEGWTNFGWIDRKWHYIVDGRSLCGRGGCTQSRWLDQGLDDSSYNCANCKRLKKLCPTCKGTRVAPVADEDLGGEGITMSSCPDCVLE